MRGELIESNYKSLTREERGRLIAQKYKITRKENGDYKVPSQFGYGNYNVKISCLKEQCDCPDYDLRKQKCKHIYAVEYILKNEIKEDQEGNTIITETKTVKISYKQDWKNYDKASISQKGLFLKLLSDLCSNIEEDYNFGRPKNKINDMLFASALKVYSTFSLRRFMSDLEIAKERNYIDSKPCFASIGHFMQRENITEILKELIKISSLPLSAIETKFAVDSSGFSTCRFARYFSYKHKGDITYRIWLKAHVMSGVKTNIITDVNITEDYDNDCPEFKHLVNKTSENFKIIEVSADKAYSSRENYNLINSLKGTAFIPFKSNATNKSRGSCTWKRMFHYFEFNKEDFLKHYHLRSNSETTFHMIKSKFGDYLRSKTKTAQVNELLLKVLCHNICVLIQEMFELGINVDFLENKVGNITEKVGQSI